MSPTVDVDEVTLRAIEFAARMSGTSPSSVVKRLVEQASTPSSTPSANRASPSDAVELFARYEGHKTEAWYYPETARVEITSGPLAGTSYKTPTAAARAVVGHFKPAVNSNRNGWSFWVLNDGTARPLQSIRRAGG